MILTFQTEKIIIASILLITIYIPAFCHVWSCYDQLSKKELCFHFIFYPLILTFCIIKKCFGTDINRAHLKNLKNIYHEIEVPTKLAAMAVFLLNNENLLYQLNIFSYFNTITIHGFYEANSIKIGNICLLLCSYYILILICNLTKPILYQNDFKVGLLEHLYGIMNLYFQIGAMIIGFLYMESSSMISITLLFIILLALTSSGIKAYKLLFIPNGESLIHSQSDYIMTSRTTIYIGNLIFCLIILNTDLLSSWEYSKFCVLSNRQANIIIISLICTGCLNYASYYNQRMNFKMFTITNILALIQSLSVLIIVAIISGHATYENVVISWFINPNHVISIITTSNNNCIPISLIIAKDIGK